MKTKRTIKAMLGFTKAMPADILARALAVFAGLSGALADFGRPPIDLGILKEAIDLYSSLITAALDGGKKAIAERTRQGEVVIRMLRELGHYVEANCKDDMPTFLKSGFQPAAGTKVLSQALSQFIRRIEPGRISGQVVVTIAAVSTAFSYELRWAAIGTGGTPDTWTTQPIVKVRPATSVTGLMPGTTYVFQVRSLSDAGYSDWSDSVTRICT